MRTTSLCGLVGLTCLLSAECWGVPAAGEVWISPDKLITVIVPPASYPIEVEQSSQVLATWATQDKSVFFMVIKTPLPDRSAFVQQSVERTFLTSMGGTLVQSETRNVDGYTAFRMSARGNLAGRRVTAIQSLIAIGDRVYTLSATGVETDILDSQTANNFVDSIQVLLSNVAAMDVGQTNASWTRGNRNTFVAVIDTAQAITCGLVLLLLVYGVVVLFLRWLRRHRSTRPTDAWINVYVMLAAVCGFASVAGIWGNVKFLMRGTGLPSDPVARRAFVVAMFVVPAVMFVVALVFFLLGRRKSRRMTMEPVSLALVSISGQVSANGLRDTPPSRGP
jgi:hypothetical protein